jgi:microcystin-dependent protein
VSNTGGIYTSAPTPPTGDNSTKIATTAFVNTVLPVGTIVSSGRSSTPTGYLYCNGSAVSRTTYANLFSAIGTTYGTGDGSTTFNLPNFTNYKIVTSGTVSVKGNGKVLGLTDGTNTYGTKQYSSCSLSRRNSVAAGSAVGVKISTGNSFPDTTTTGIATDAAKSGITGSVSTATIKWYIKY